MSGWLVNFLIQFKEFNELLLKSTFLYDTPQFLIIEDTLNDRVELIKNAFQKQFLKTKIYYAYKACDLPYICEKLYKSRLGAEVASDLELDLARSIGQKEIIFNGPGKTKKEIELAINNSAVIIVDNFEELGLINKIAFNLKIKASIGVRLSMPFIKNRNWARFGIQPNLLPEFLKLTRKEFISFKGIHFHIGTEIENPGIYIKNIIFLSNLLKKLNSFDRKQINFINIGGGFGVEGYRKRNYPEYKFNFLNVIKSIPINFSRNKSIENFAQDITEAFRGRILSLKDLANVELWLEPGRWIIDPVIHLLTKVLYTKDGGIILDGNIVFCHRVVKEIHPVFNLSNFSFRKIEQKLYGSLGRPDDLIGKFYFGQELKRGNIVCLANLGAYSNIDRARFVKPLPRIVCLSNGNLRLLAKEETFEQRYQRFI